MKNQGISLISLIITIIVIIILAAIVIFSGMDTPERAQLANFDQEITNVHHAVVDQLAGVSTEFATARQSRNTEQLYYKLATGKDVGQFGAMVTDDSKMPAEGSGNNYMTTEDMKCQRIIPAHAERKTTVGGLGLTLPKIRESNDAWYITENGIVFNATGFVAGGKTYFTADAYYAKEITMDAADRTNHYADRAEEIAAFLVSGESGALNLSAGVVETTR